MSDGLSRRVLLTGGAALVLLRTLPTRSDAGPCASAGPSAILTPPGEPGERLTVTGQVFAPDGVTPAAGVILYAYHTDAEGHYARERDAPPRLRGWLRTDASGAYRYVTIRPAPYPGRQIAAHVHMQLGGAGFPAQGSNALLFEGDPYLTKAERRESASLGRFAFIRTLTHEADGLHAVHDLRLKRTGDHFEENNRNGLAACGLA